MSLLTGCHEVSWRLEYAFGCMEMVELWIVVFCMCLLVDMSGESSMDRETRWSACFNEHCWRMDTSENLHHLAVQGVLGVFTWMVDSMQDQIEGDREFSFGINFWNSYTCSAMKREDWCVHVAVLYDWLVKTWFAIWHVEEVLHWYTQLHVRAGHMIRCEVNWHQQSYWVTRAIVYAHSASCKFNPLVLHFILAELSKLEYRTKNVTSGRLKEMCFSSHVHYGSKQTFACGQWLG